MDWKCRSNGGLSDFRPFASWRKSHEDRCCSVPNRRGRGHFQLRDFDVSVCAWNHAFRAWYRPRVCSAFDAVHSLSVCRVRVVAGSRGSRNRSSYFRACAPRPGGGGGPAAGNKVGLSSPASTYLATAAHLYRTDHIYPPDERNGRFSESRV